VYKLRISLHRGRGEEHGGHREQLFHLSASQSISSCVGDRSHGVCADVVGIATLAIVDIIPQILPSENKLFDGSLLMLGKN
jgi:hypothetical protein